MGISLQNWWKLDVFSALHFMQTRSSDENSVRLSFRPSVCPFVKRIHCDKTEERSVQIFKDDHRTLLLSPKRAQKTQNGHFPSIIALRLTKVCYVSLCENYQRQGYEAFIVLTIRAKMISGGNPFYLKFWVKLTALERNRRVSIYSRS